MTMYEKPQSKNTRTISEKDYTRLILQAETLGDRALLAEAMELYGVTIEDKTTDEALRMIRHHFAKAVNA